MIITKLIQIDTPSPITGRIFSEKIIDKMISEFQPNGCIGTMNFDYPIDILNISHLVKKLYKSDGWLMCEIEILDTPKGNELKAILESPEFRICGLGETGQDGIVKEFTLTHVVAVSGMKE